LSAPVDALTAALALLARRELSTKQLRDRLTRRQFDPGEIESVIARLTRDGTVDDRRVALASARVQAAIKGRGRRRVLQQVQQLGISAAMAKTAVEEVFGELDETALLESAIERRLKGVNPRSLDQKAIARIVRGLAAQGFEPGQVYTRLRQRTAEAGE
jgi:regulatory protein